MTLRDSSEILSSGVTNKMHSGVYAYATTVRRMIHSVRIDLYYYALVG